MQLGKKRLISRIGRGNRNGSAQLINRNNLEFQGVLLGELLNGRVLKDTFLKINISNANGIPPELSQEISRGNRTTHQMHENGKSIVTVFSGEPCYVCL